MWTYEDIASLPTEFQMKRTPKHVAAITSGDTLVEFSTNVYAQHAEAAAMTRFMRRCHHSKKRPMRMYVVRVGSNKMSRPCRDCCAMLRRYPHIRVFYSERDGSWAEETRFDSTHFASRRAQFYQRQRDG